MPWTFDAPAGLQDFTDPAHWHDHMSRVADGILIGLLEEVEGKHIGQITQAEVDARLPQLAYVNPVRSDVPETAETLSASVWGGFPQSVRRQRWDTITAVPDPDDPDGHFRAVEMRGSADIGHAPITDPSGSVYDLPVRQWQDEYLEWAVADDGRSIAFTCEGYDYYTELFQHDEDVVVDLYKRLTGNDAITADDLRASRELTFVGGDGLRRRIAEAGGFNPRNRFNQQGGIVHLSHRANSLGAEVNLAGVASLARMSADGAVLDGDDAERLICCNHAGAINRDSDPTITKAGYEQTVGGFRFTLANPIGLYIAGVDFGGLQLPEATGDVPRDWWNVVRGHGLDTPEQSRVLRLELRVPDGETIGGRPMRLDDLEIAGRKLRHPSRLAGLISLHLFVTRWPRDGGGIGPVVPCRGTCCHVQGNPWLERSAGTCRDGLTIRFPGLVADGSLASGGAASLGLMGDQDMLSRS